MENVLPKYERPIAKIDDPVSQVSFWDEAKDAFDKKNYKESIIAVINYLNPSLLKGKNMEGKVEVLQMQGSAEIQIIITDTLFSVKAPFLRINEKTNKVALLRKVAEVNFSPLNLEQIRLINDELWFQYEIPLELSQPNKVYDIIRNIAIYADDFDDLFINNYHAEFYKQPNYTELTSKEQELVWTQIENVFADYKNYSSFFKEKRLDAFVWDILVISMLKISNMPYVHGKLRTDLIEHIGMLFNTNYDYNFRIDKGVNYMKKLMAYSRKDLLKNLYHTEQFISLRWRSYEEAITERLKENLKQVEEYERDENYFNVSYYLQFVFLKLIYDDNLEENYKKAIYDVLEDVSGLDPDDAGPKLIKVFYEMQNGFTNKEEPKKVKKGFFAKLFN